MKLSAHYNKVSIIITISGLVAGAIIYFFAINYFAKQQLDNNLTEEIDGIKNYIKVNHQLPKQVDFDEDMVIFKIATNNNFQPRFFDTTYLNPKEKKIEPGRGISCVVQVGHTNYSTILILSREDTEYLVQIIGIIALVLTLGLLLVLFLTNRYMLNDLWKPFYRTLTELKSFNVSDNRSLNLKVANVDEFNELNETVKSMSFKVKQDFNNLKQFTENASHEMQTPLAVITAKLDTLIQEEVLESVHYEHINDIYAATNKLARLNQSLLLLVKIENNLIDDAEPLLLNVLIAEKIQQFQELCLSRQLTVKADLSEKEILASKFLTDILLNNLFSNAIRHNINGGEIYIRLKDCSLIFSNSGLSRQLEKDKIFERFIKGQQSEGTGLGLALVKNICHLNGWEISYNYSNMIHSFEIVFSNTKANS